MNRTSRRIAVLTSMMAVPIAVGATVGTATVSADPWHYGPVYRVETSGENAPEQCLSRQDYETLWSFIIVPCTNVPGTDTWGLVVFNPIDWGWQG